MVDFILWPKPTFMSTTCDKIIIDDKNVDEKPLGQWQFLQHFRPINPSKFYKEWHYNVGLTLVSILLIFQCEGEKIQKKKLKLHSKL